MKPEERPRAEGRTGSRMGRIRRRSPLSLAVLATLLLVVVALSATEEWAFLESSSENRIVLPDTPFPLAYVAMAAIGILIVCVLALRVGEQRPRRERGSRSALRPLAVALALLALWVMFPPIQQLVSNLIRDPDEGGRQTEVETQERPERGAGTEETETVRSRPLGWAVILAFALAALAVLAALIVLVRQNPETPAPRRRRLHRGLIKEIEASERDLRTIDDPRAAVIACYSRMQKAVTVAGVGRRESDTPFELLDRLALDDRIPQIVARRLTELFETAKFSLRPVDENMRMQALDCLGRVREALEGASA
jgi:NADH:ubiquinone oxidoreductase subunit 6 (subunit J)